MKRGWYLSSDPELAHYWESRPEAVAGLYCLCPTLAVAADKAVAPLEGPGRAWFGPTDNGTIKLCEHCKLALRVKTAPPREPLIVSPPTALSMLMAEKKKKGKR